MNVLILKPSSLGDVVQALPVLRLIKQAKPHAHIYWWLNADLVPLLEGDPDLPGDADSPLLDMSDVGVRKMIAKAKARGYVTYDELNKVLPSDKTSSEQIEDTMAMLNEMGINVIESEEAEEGEEGGALVEASGSKALAKIGRAHV